MPCEGVALGTSKSSADRTTCECSRLAGGGPFDALHFDTAAAACVDVPADFVAPAPPALADTIYTKSAQTACEPGHRCALGVRSPCLAGRYGALPRSTASAQCDGPCTAGFYCPEASVSPTPHACGGAHLYCPRGSAAPTFVVQGRYSNEDAAPTARSWTSVCEPGYTCFEGERTKCAPGRYASEKGTFDPACDGQCDAGHYCEEGSASKTQHVCGAGHFCPQGSSAPTPIETGHYGAHQWVLRKDLGQDKCVTARTLLPWRRHFSAAPTTVF